MATKTTKNNKQLTYPCIVEIKMAMGSKRKTEVIRAIDRVTGQDLSKSIVYPTLRNAFYAGVDLVKESIDSKWVRIEKTDAEARQVITNEGLVDHIAQAPAPAPAAPKQPKPKKAKAPKAATPAKSKKGKTKTSATGGMTIEEIEPTEAEIQAIQDMLDMDAEDQDAILDSFDSL